MTTGRCGEGLLAVPASLQASPYNYGAGRRVEVRDEQGRVLDLKPGADREYRAEFTATATPGDHKLTLLIDGKVRAEATCRVLGRP